MIFSADGTFSATGVPSYVDPQRGVVFGGSAMGVWEPTGERSIHVTWVQVLSDLNGTYLGTFTLDGYPEVSADGQTWDDEGTQVHFTIRDASNAIVMEAGGGMVRNRPRPRCTRSACRSAILASRRGRW